MIPDKKKDQHILINPKINIVVANTASLTSRDNVLEIGGGPGTLTSIIARNAGHVYSIEKDKGYYAILEKTFVDSKNIELIFGDVLTVKLPLFNKIVSNPPYQILQQFFIRLIKEKRYNFECCVMIIPHKFTKLILTKPEDKDFGLISAIFDCFYKVNIVMDVSKEAFEPMPRVLSHLVKITPKGEDSSIRDKVIRNIFLHLDKKIGKSIMEFFWNGDEGFKRHFTKKESKSFLEKNEATKIKKILDKRVLELSDKEIKELYRFVSQLLATFGGGGI